ncbi:MAG TPA: rhamnulokinase family protein [Bryobacterales bacterium]|nr:rhamnulokinase family protein [Bryobacterales bacterium]
MSTRNFVAFDLGAESGRAMLGRFDGERLRLEEAHRFANGPVRVLDSLHWDALRLFDEMKKGLAAAARRAGGEIASIGVDTWGVDYALLGPDGALVENPYHYRDARTNGVMEKLFAVVPREQVFERTGIQFMQLNTLYQLYALRLARPHVLEQARTLVMMPDLFHYWFTGRAASEYTIATTTQFYDPRQRAWAREMLERLGIPARILPEIVSPGTKLGALLAPVAEETGAGAPVVIAPASHDTGSAVAAVPAQGGDWAFLSSGTWSLLGAEVAAPIINRATLEANFTNEGGVWETIRLLKNISGMWLLEECRREWAKEGSAPGYAELCEAALRAKPFGAILDPDDAPFLSPGAMPAKIAEFCRRTGQRAPEGQGAITRAIFESLALTYRAVIEKLETILGRRLRTLHIVGGGSRNAVLCQFTADATGLTVIAGPEEATALGNVLLQAMALGEAATAADARELVRRSFEPRTYTPGSRDIWDEAAARRAGLVGQAAKA